MLHDVILQIHVADQFAINQRIAKCEQHKDKLSEAIFMNRKFKQ
jgi:hypothetical protein